MGKFKNLIPQDRIELDSDNLDIVWRKWVETTYGDNQAKMRLYSRTKYRGLSRISPVTSEFEDWLFSQGGRIEQRNGKRYVVFDDESMASWFILRYL